MLRVNLPATVDGAQLESEIVNGTADRLRDDHGMELLNPGEIPQLRGTLHEYRLLPKGSIVIHNDHHVLTVDLHRVDVDAKDLFTAVCGDIEQRHSGLDTTIS